MYRARIEKDLAIWVGRGFVTDASARAMLAEYDARETTFSLGRVLMLIAAVLFGAALLMLIAANWEAIPRLMRVGGVIGLLWLLTLSAAFWLRRGATGLGEAALVLASMTFGGAIALIGQMYHLSGDATDTLLLWLGSTAFSAVLFRSRALCVIGALQLFVLFVQLASENDSSLVGNGLIYLIPILAILLLALVRYTKAGYARHLAYLLMLSWLGWFYLEISEVWLCVVYVAIGIVAFCAAALPASPLAQLARSAGAAPAFYSFALAILGLAALHGEADDLSESTFISAAMLAVSIGGIVIAGRTNGAVRFLGYAAFSLEILYLAFETLGSIIGTAGFFLLSGLVVAAIAAMVVWLEKRLAARRPVKEA